MKLKNRVIIWPVYLDSRYSRKLGRRIPKHLAVDNPKLEELLEAAKNLGLNPESRLGKAYPRSWWDRSGYLVVDKKFSKQELLKKLAEEVLKARGVIARRASR
ncbi:MAG: signal recognition particle protein Srp19 [Nitrososphaerota archaeon]|nr:signal recognition particle protein Srp19 [Candidatus Bathyarchaeota archaeon]MCX8161419.1 signal recognition particle protein Srp19 [Candidatus Bathyarchaeota archaeon]MDW8061400.1 signal recognition particle protein Srp19 [Nitrososphaerota archaeon]